MREPSIHITKARLVSILEAFLERSPGSEWLSDEQLVEGLASYITKEGSRYQLSRRKLIVGNQIATPVRRKLAMSASSYKADAQSFAKILLSIRKSKKHRGLKIIKEGSSEWNILKEVTSLATNFARDFDLELTAGYKEYIQAALVVMPSFALNRVNYKHEEICKTYESIREIRSDGNPKITQELYDAYYQIVSAKTGITNNYRDRPLKFVFFCRAASIVKELKVTPVDYVKAQFKSLEWINGLPDPSQLVGDGAIERLQKHLYNNSKNIIRDEKELRTIMLGQ